MNVSSLRYKISFCLFFSSLLCAQQVQSAPAPENNKVFLEFLCDLQTYYADAGWVCKAFESMDLQAFVLSWHQLSELLASSHARWFYTHESAKAYDADRATTYRTISRYLYESCDMFWIKECREYRKFLLSHAVDTVNQKIIDKADMPKPTSTEFHNFVILQDFLAQADQQSLTNFYQLFFEQLVNVILNKLNYLYESGETSQDQAYELVNDARELDDIYHVCCHKVQPPADLARAFAYHYERIQSVFQLTIQHITAQALGEDTL